MRARLSAIKSVECCFIHENLCFEVKMSPRFQTIKTKNSQKEIKISAQFDRCLRSQQTKKCWDFLKIK